jgi:hypothetical protein
MSDTERGEHAVGNTLESDLAEVREAVKGLLVPGEVDLIAVFAWHGISLRVWKGGDPATCGSACMNGHGRCGKSSRYFGLHSREAKDGLLADIRAGEKLLPALQKWSG